MLMRNRKKGFTLIEVLVSITIIGFISGIIAVNTSRSRSFARDSTRVADIGSIQAGLGLYFVDNRRFPSTLSPLVPTYMGQLPTDPQTGASYVYSGVDGNGSAGTCESYHLAAVMENDGYAAMTQDSDALSSGTACTGSTPLFNGNAANCSGTTAATPDRCYDIASQ